MVDLRFVYSKNWREAGHDLPRKILDWRQVAKLKSTYTDALPGHVNPNDASRAHRLCAGRGNDDGTLVVVRAEPPEHSRSATRKAARSARPLSPAAGNKLVSADYSQIELRLMAEIAQCPPPEARRSQRRPSTFTP